eukprot:m.285525 g.285525  ORF g.285525 m.285525 type:complete len:1495 (-) comp19434_c6_seq2:106-4590(-)
MADYGNEWVEDEDGHPLPAGWDPNHDYSQVNKQAAVVDDDLYHDPNHAADDADDGPNGFVDVTAHDLETYAGANVYEGPDFRADQFDGAFWTLESAKTMDTGFEELRKEMAKGSDFCRDFAAIFRERAALEEAHGKALQKLKARASKLQAPNGTLGAAWNLVVGEFDDRSELHLSTAKYIKQNLVDPATQYDKQLKREHKARQQAVEKALRSYGEVTALAQKCERTAHAKSKEAESATAQLVAAQHNTAKPVPESTIQKMTKTAEKANKYRDKADNSYRDAMRKAQQGREDWETAVICNCRELQTAEANRIRFFQSMFTRYSDSLLDQLPRLQQSLQTCKTTAAAINAENDCRDLANERGTGTYQAVRALYNPYEVDLDHKMDNERRKRVLAERLRTCHSDFHQRVKTREGLYKLWQAMLPTSTTMGSVFAIKRQLVHGEYAIAASYASLNAVRNSLLASCGKTPEAHTFKDFVRPQPGKNAGPELRTPVENLIDIEALSAHVQQLAASDDFGDLTAHPAPAAPLAAAAPVSQPQLLPAPAPPPPSAAGGASYESQAVYEDEFGDEDDDDDDDDFSDDDDMSWKVRRAASKCLAAIIRSRPDLLLDFYARVSPVLVKRFKEREENVRVDVLTTFCCVLQQTALATHNLPPAAAAASPAASALRPQIPAVVRALQKPLRDRKSIKTRQAGLAVLGDLARAAPGALTEHVRALMPAVLFSLTDKSSNSNVKIESLQLIDCLLQTHDAACFHPVASQLVATVVGAVDESFYKIASEALGVCIRLVHMLRPDPRDPTPVPQDRVALGRSVHDAVITRLRASDIDQEVKDKAILCTGHLISTLGDHLADQLDVVLPLLLARLQNEITRVVASKALALVASSPLHINLDPIMTDAVQALSTFLRKNNRVLRLAALYTLNVVIRSHAAPPGKITKRRRVETQTAGQPLGAELFQAVLAELPPLITPSDLQSSQLAISVATAIVRSLPETAQLLTLHVQAIQTLLVSPVLQGPSLEAVGQFFLAMVAAGSPQFTTKSVFDLLVAPAYSAPPAAAPTLPKQTFFNIATVLATIMLPSVAQVHELAAKFAEDVQREATGPSVKLLALATLGELGKAVDLSQHSNLVDIIVSAFRSPHEEVKSTAACALGSVCVGNLPKYLPFVLSEIKRQPTWQYLLLHALKEVIVWQSASPATIETLRPFAEEIWSLLLDHCENEEEGTRNVVAECLGKLTLVDPSKLLALQAQLESASPLRRCTLITSVKYTLADQSSVANEHLRQALPHFFKAITDENVSVRRVALVTLNSAAHNRPALIRDLLPELLPLLYEQTKVNAALVRQVEMGPFKHTVDDGLDARKSAFECMYTLLHTCADRLFLPEFLEHVHAGLGDHYDIQMLTYLMLARLAATCPEEVLRRLDDFSTALEKTMTAKLKSNAVKQEVEKSEELKKSALRAVAALQHVPGSDASAKFTSLVKTVQSIPALAAKLESLHQHAPDAASTAMDTSEV